MIFGAHPYAVERPRRAPTGHGRRHLRVSRSRTWPAATPTRRCRSVSTTSSAAARPSPSPIRSGCTSDRAASSLLLSAGRPLPEDWVRCGRGERGHAPAARVRAARRARGVPRRHHASPSAPPTSRSPAATSSLQQLEIGPLRGGGGGIAARPTTSSGARRARPAPSPAARPSRATPCATLAARVDREHGTERIAPRTVGRRGLTWRAPGGHLPRARAPARAATSRSSSCGRERTPPAGRRRARRAVGVLPGAKAGRVRDLGGVAAEAGRADASCSGSGPTRSRSRAPPAASARARPRVALPLPEGRRRRTAPARLGPGYAPDVRANLATEDYLRAGRSRTRSSRSTGRSSRPGSLPTAPIRRRARRRSSCATFYLGFQRDDRRSWIDFHDGLSNLRATIARR